MYNPNVKLVDVYKDGVWGCKVEYHKAFSTQDVNNHQNFSWEYAGIYFDMDNNPGVALVQQLQFSSFPSIVPDDMTRIDL